MPIMRDIKCIMMLSWDHLMQGSNTNFQDNQDFLNLFCPLILTDTNLDNPKGLLPND